MWYTGTYAPPPGTHISPDRHLHVEYRSWADYWRCTKEIFGNRDFLSITLANFMHILRSTSHLNFAPIFTEALIPETIFPRGGLLISGFYAFCAQIPQVRSNDEYVELALFWFGDSFSFVIRNRADGSDLKQAFEKIKKKREENQEF